MRFYRRVLSALEENDSLKLRETVMEMDTWEEGQVFRWLHNRQKHTYRTLLGEAYER